MNKFFKSVNSKYYYINFLLIFFIINLNTTYSQIDNYFLSRAKKGEVDTLAVQTSQKVAKETVGLLEKEINPETYILGPNDEISILILTPKPVEHNLTISPVGRILIPSVGSVDLKGKSLAQAEVLIRERIKKIYKVDDISIDLKDIRKFKVIVSGEVSKPSIVAATAVDRVSEVIERCGGLTKDASMRKIKLLRAEDNKLVNVDLIRFFMLGDKSANPTVLGGDQIIIHPSNENQRLEIEGEVPSPGEFEFVEGDSLSTLFRFAHGLLNSSFLDSVEVVRFIGSSSDVERFFVNIENWKNIFDYTYNLPGDFPLQIGDRVYIRQIASWQKPFYVHIHGEVNFPGKYAINRQGFRIRDLILRSGGFTEDASLESSILIRVQEKEKKDPEMERLRAIPSSEMSENERRYFQARNLEQKGVMAINFTKIMNDPSVDDNIFLIDQDSIIVPQKKNFVNVQGRVNNPGLVIYKPEYTYLDYINLAGGFGFRADDGATFITKSKGEQFLAEDMNYLIEPGDNILVPPESETTFGEVFRNGLTIASQIVTILGVVIALSRF